MSNKHLTTGQISELINIDSNGHGIRAEVQELISRLTAKTAPATLAQMIAAGRYDWANDDITEKNFPVNPERFNAAGLEVIHFNKRMTTAQIEAELDRRGLRPASIEELLAYGAERPEEQRKFPIVALASSWVHPFGGRHVPYLDGGGRERKLCLDWVGPDCEWGEFYRFLAVRK